MSFQMFKLVLEKAEIKLPTSAGSSKKQEVSRKTPTFALVTTPKPLTVWITTNCGKFWKRWEYQTTWPASWEICMQVKKQQLELDMEQQTGSKLGKEYVKAVYCHPAYLTSMQSTSCEMPGWMKHKLESRFPGEISVQFSRSVVSDSATSWTAARQAFLSITNSWSLLKLVHWVGDAIQPSRPLLFPSPPAFSLCYPHFKLMKLNQLYQWKLPCS